MKNLSIDVIIPSYRAEYVNLKRITTIKPENSKVKLRFIIIIDNPNIPRKNLKWIENVKEDILMIRNKRNRGASYSRNIGLDHSNADYVLFLDDDIVPGKAFIEKYVNAIKENPSSQGFIGVTQFPRPINSFTKGLVYSDILTFFTYPNKVREMGWGVTANLMVKREVIGDIRFRSDKFPKKGGGEDIDFCLNIVDRVGDTFQTVPDANVMHPWWNCGRIHLNRFFRWAFGDSILPRLFPEHKYWNFPNFLEFVIMSFLFIFLLLNLKLFIIWICFLLLSEFLIDYLRMSIKFGQALEPLSILLAVVVIQSNNAGRIVGYVKNKMMPLMQRFDYFTTGVSLTYERKVGFVKCMVYLLITLFILNI